VARIWFRARTKEGAEQIKREFEWLIYKHKEAVKEGDQEKAKKFEEKIQRWLDAHPDIKKQLFEHKLKQLVEYKFEQMIKSAIKNIEAKIIEKITFDHTKPTHTEPTGWHFWKVELFCKADDDYFKNCGRNCIRMKEKNKLSRCMFLSYRIKEEESK